MIPLSSFVVSLVDWKQVISLFTLISQLSLIFIWFKGKNLSVNGNKSVNGLTRKWNGFSTHLTANLVPRSLGMWFVTKCMHNTKCCPTLFVTIPIWDIILIHCFIRIWAITHCFWNTVSVETLNILQFRENYSWRCSLVLLLDIISCFSFFL